MGHLGCLAGSCQNLQHAVVTRVLHSVQRHILKTPGSIVSKIYTGQWHSLFLRFVKDLAEPMSAGLEVKPGLKLTSVQ